MKIINENVKTILAIASFIAAIGFGIAGIIIYPAGIIHGSVLILIAQLLVLCATLIGLNITIDLEKKHFETKHNKPDDVELIQKALENDEQDRVIINQLKNNSDK